MENTGKFNPNPQLKLMDQVRETLRYYHYAYRTEQTYCDWIRRYLLYYEMKRHPAQMGAPEVERFLSHLATHDKVAASTQRQALNAIVFLYRDVLNRELDSIAPVRSRRHRKPPTVLTKAEVVQVLSQMEGTHRLMARLMYGCGLRLMECIRLRVKDVDVNRASPYFFQKLSARCFGVSRRFLFAMERAARIVWYRFQKFYAHRWLIIWSV